MRQRKALGPLRCGVCLRALYARRRRPNGDHCPAKRRQDVLAPGIGDMTGTPLTDLIEGSIERIPERRPVGDAQYAPLSSVWEGSDGELLERMLRFYASVPPEPVLDSTYNSGRFWRESTRRVVSMDINPKFRPMIVGDNRKMEGFRMLPSGPSYTIRRTSAPRGGTRAKRDSTRISERRSSAERSKGGALAISIPHS